MDTRVTMNVVQCTTQYMVEVNFAICGQHIFPETTVQRMPITVEDEQHQERKESPLCIYHSDINKLEYHNAVYTIDLGVGIEHSRVFDDFDKQRFKLRAEWIGTESA